jgi:hypothetical protein
MFRTELPHASRVVRPASARRRITVSTSCSFTKWNWMFWRVVICPKRREYFSPTSASAYSWSLVIMPCGTFTRIICASIAWRWPYVPRTRRNERH